MPADGGLLVGTHRVVCGSCPREAVQKSASERGLAWLRASLVTRGCSPFEFCSWPLMPGPSPSGSSCLFSHDIDGMVRPIVVNGGATRNSSSKLLSFGSEECSIGAERMSDWLSKKMVTCNIPSSIAEICPVTRRRTSRFCFTEADHRKVASLWILSGGSRGGSPLRSLTRCVRAMFPVAAHLLDTDFRLFLRVGT